MAYLSTDWIIPGIGTDASDWRVRKITRPDADECYAGLAIESNLQPMPGRTQNGILERLCNLQRADLNKIGHFALIICTSGTLNPELCSITAQANETQCNIQRCGPYQQIA